MIRKYGTINEEVNRIKSLFGESRLYGNLVEQSDEIDNSNSIVCTESGCKGEYSGVEHNTDVKPSDVAHQFSNTMSTDVGNKLKELYGEGIYVKVDFDGIEMTTEGMDQKDDVVYKLNIPFKKVDEKCKAMTSFDHVGGWGHSPKLEARKGELSGALLSGDELDISELKKTTEGLEEYWIQWRNKNTQLECEGIVDIRQNNDDKPEGWYEKPVDVLKKYGVPPDVIGKMEGNGDQDGDYNWEYKDSKFSIKIYGIDGKADWGQFHFIEEGKSGWDEYWVGKLIIVYDIGKDDQNSRVMEGTLFWNYLLDGKYDDLFYGSKYGVESETEGEIKNGYITIDGETTDPFKVGGEIVKSVDDEIYKKVQELRSNSNEDVGDGTEDVGDGTEGGNGDEEETVNQTDTNGNKTGVWETKHKNGKIKERGGYDNDKRVGEWKFYDKSGKLTTTGEYVNGKAEGEWITTNWDGVEMTANYKNGNQIITLDVDIKEEDIIRDYKNKKYNIGKFVYDKKNDEFKIKSKYPFLLKRTNGVVENMRTTFWETLSKWYDYPLTANNTSLEVVNNKKFKVTTK